MINEWFKLFSWSGSSLWEVEEEIMSSLCAVLVFVFNVIMSHIL